MKPDFNKLIHCLDILSEALDMTMLPKDKAIALLNHVLFDGSYNEQEGKRAWESYEVKLITKSELVNLVLAHSVTKISNHNAKQEPNSGEYLTEKMWHDFEDALLRNNGLHTLLIPE